MLISCRLIRYRASPRFPLPLTKRPGLGVIANCLRIICPRSSDAIYSGWWSKAEICTQSLILGRDPATCALPKRLALERWHQGRSSLRNLLRVPLMNPLWRLLSVEIKPGEQEKQLSRLKHSDWATSFSCRAICISRVHRNRTVPGLILQKFSMLIVYCSRHCNHGFERHTVVAV